MIHRKSTHELVKDIQQAGGCSHPVRLRGEFINVAIGEVNERPLLVACEDRRAVLCPSCSPTFTKPMRGLWSRPVSSAARACRRQSAITLDYPSPLQLPRLASCTADGATVRVSPVE
jgi:hypothetical protein